MFSFVTLRPFEDLRNFAVFMDEGNNVPITLREVATWVEGEVIGDADLIILDAKPISDAQLNDITFIEDEKYLPLLHRSMAQAAVVPKDFKVENRSLIRVKDPLIAFVTIFQKFHPRSESTFHGIHPTALIHPSAKIGDNVNIGAFVTIGEGVVIGNRCQISNGVSIASRCRIGEDVKLHPNVVLYDDCILGNRVMISANSVIGADGFGYRLVQGKHIKIPQLGYVEIGDDVEIGACTTIDRATFGGTRIGAGTKIDNLVMIAHNCQIGKNNLIVSQVGIAGSVTTGDYVIMAGQVGVADHLTIGNQVVIGAKCGVVKDVGNGVQLHGIPGRPAKEQLRIVMSTERLPELVKEVRKIKQHLGMNEESDAA
jgi:UDP-3-O-[3-hydroxymyristoyl] glucosamine N-acyltransferase